MITVATVLSLIGMNDANITDENLNQGFRNLEDIRKITITEDGDHLVATAFYVDKSQANDFKGYWYGWQVGGRGLVWTPLGFNDSRIKKPTGSMFTEVKVYKYEQKDGNVNSSNTNATWLPN